MEHVLGIGSGGFSLKSHTIHSERISPDFRMIYTEKSSRQLALHLYGLLGGGAGLDATRACP